ncbi:MAG: glycoside hydrolase family 3 N-terminal domain-containing protein [Balneolales bacterium]
MKKRHFPLIFSVFLLFHALPGQVDPTNETDLEGKIAQMLIVGFRGLELHEDMAIVHDIRERGIGGVILFDYDVPSGKSKRNIRSAGQVRALNKDLQALSEDRLFISIDQEGGRVSRLKEQYGFPSTVSHQALGTYNDADSSRAFAAATAALLARLGFNLNFSPVVDVNSNPANPVIGKLERSFSQDPDRVSRHAEAFVSAHHEKGVMAAVKHFPGHGSAWNDSHLGMADVTETWNRSELAPYRYLIGKGLIDVIMTAHIFNENLDPDHPATLSRDVIEGLLREKLGYRGVVVSDDMQMKAITEYYGLKQALKLSINAGVDMLIFANNSVYEEDIAERAIALIRTMVEDGEIPRERIEESYRRIKKLKSVTA